MTLRLGKLPDRRPVKLTLAINPALYAKLTSYADLYASTYGTPAKIEDLAAVMIEKFLDSDTQFRRATKQQLNQPKGD